MMKNKAIKISNDMYLISQSTSDRHAAAVQQSVHHVFVIDCSGSMHGALDDIRRDLCNKMATLLKEGDSMSLIWFSGRGEYGVALEDYRINGPMNVDAARRVVNSHLVARGLTAFVGPLQAALHVINGVEKRDSGKAHSLFFMTDGCDNQHSVSDILRAACDLNGNLSSATVIEYGWYCNRSLMTKIAAELGGSHRHNSGFQDYEPLVSSQFSSASAPKRELVSLCATPANGIAFAVGNGITVYKVENGKALVQYGERSALFFMSDTPGTAEVLEAQADSLSEPEISGVYAAMSVASKTLDNAMFDALMRYAGDCRLASISANAFGAQKITELEKEIESAAMNANMRYSLGYSKNVVPEENAYCFMDMIADLMDGENAWYPRHDSFSYERTGKKMVSAQNALYESEKKELAEAVASGDMRRVKELTDKIGESRAYEPIFEHASENPGCPFDSLVWNGTRANLSVQVTFAGKIELPENKFGIPRDFQTVIVRTYTLVKDGIIHTYVIPVSLCETTFNKLQSHGLLRGETYAAGKIYELDFSSLPVVNRKMAKTRPSAEKLCRMTYEMNKLRGYSAVLTYYRGKHSVSSHKGFAELYGAEGAEWLKEMGVMPYGFSPKRIAETVGEEQSVPALDVKILKASLPSGKAEIEKVIAKIEAGKELSLRERWFEQAIRDYTAFVKLTSGMSDKHVIEWLDARSKDVNARRRAIMREIASIKFVIIVGRLWFAEFASRAERTLPLNIDGIDYVFELDDTEEIIKL